MKSHLKISIIIPVYNGESTLEKTLESLLSQSKKFDELIIIDDASTDRSVCRLNDFLYSRQKYVLLKNENQQGLANSYNQGINASKGDLVITLHQDVILENDALERLTAPFSDKQIVASTHIVTHPLEIWQQYNFWQKCFFSRLAGKNFSGIDGKFDCFRKSALQKTGLFDSVHFRSAGEDGDMVFRLEKIGKVAKTEAKIIHLHKIDPNFSWKDIIYKQAQYSEAQGALFRRGRIRKMQPLVKSFFREILLIGLLVPFLWMLSVATIIVYSFLFTLLVFQKEYKDMRILILPFFNIFLLFVSLVYSFKGIVYGKQTL